MSFIGVQRSKRPKCGKMTDTNHNFTLLLDIPALFCCTARMPLFSRISPANYLLKLMYSKIQSYL